MSGTFADGLTCLLLSDILVCLVTLEVESFGLEALAEVNVVENRRVVPRMTAAAATAVPASPAPAGETLGGIGG